MSGLVASFFVGALCGSVIALAWALHIMERRAKSYKEAPVELRITPEVASQIADDMVHQWLERRGLVAMPREREFTWPGEVKR